MTKRGCASVLLAVALAAVLPVVSRAAWNPVDGNAACVASGDQVFPRACQDGSGGVFVVWEDHRGANADIYAQHFTRQGSVAPGWGANGNVVCSASGNQLSPVVAPDDSGGVIIAWVDGRGNDYDIRAVRIGAEGGVVAGWVAGGTEICAAPSDQKDLVIMADGQRGAFFAWSDFREGTGYGDIYAVRFLSTGARNQTWVEGGTRVSPNLGSRDEAKPAMVRSSDGGLFLGWENRLEGKVEVQKLSVVGSLLWNGQPVVPFSYPQTMADVRLAEDNIGGVYVGMTRSDPDQLGYGVYVHRVSSAGGVPWSVPTRFDTIGDETGLVVSPDGQGGCLAVWRRTSVPGDTYIRAKITRLNSDGAVAAGWASGGTNAPTENEGSAYNPAVYADGSGGAFIVWVAALFGSPNWISSYKFNGNGLATAGWTAPTHAFALGGPLSAPTLGASVASDGSGGIYVVSSDNAGAGAGSDVWAQLITGGGVVAPDVDPPVAVASLDGSTAKNTILATWTAPHDQLGGGPVSQYDLRVSNVALTATTFYAGTRVTTSTPLDPGETECVTVGGLTACQYYWLAVRSADENGNWSEVSNIPVVHTKCSGASSLACAGALRAAGQDDSQAEAVELSVYREIRRGTVECEVHLAAAMRLRLDILDVAGRVVATLADDVLPSGSTLMQWDGTDRAGNRARRGVYFARALTPNAAVSRKLVVIP